MKSLSNDVAVIHAKLRLTNQTPKGDVTTPQLRQNLFSFVVQRFDDHWLCVSAYNTDIVSGSETNIVDEGGSIKSVDYRN